MSILYCIISCIFQGISDVIAIFRVNDFKIQENKRIFIITTVCMSMLICVLYLIPNQFRIIYTIIINLVLMISLLKVSVKQGIFSCLIFIMLLSISEIIVSCFMSMFNFDSNLIVNNLFYNMIANIFISVGVIILLKINKVFTLIKVLNRWFNFNKISQYYAYLIILSIYILVAINGLMFESKQSFILNIMFLIVLIGLFIWIIINDINNNKLHEINQQMLNYVTKYEQIITEKGKANHEFKNQLMVIRGYAQMNKPDKLLEYIDGVVEDSKKTGSSYLISQLNNFPDGGIKGLLYYKLSLMDDFKIKYEINVEEGVKTKLDSLNTTMYNNITKILGVLLDNAIDACKQTRKKKIIIAVNKEKNNVVFNIYNTYKGKLDVSKIGTGYTTKGKNHGYGLRLVKDIVDSNKNLGVEKYLEKDYYVSKLIIKIPIKRKK